MIDCEACAKPSSGLYIASCRECSVRHLSRSLSYWKAKQAGKMTKDYKQALEAVFGSEWQEGHKKVKDYDTIHTTPNS